MLVDALTSIFAIAALCAGKYLDWTWMDALSGQPRALVILRWSIGLLKDSGAVLLDFEPDASLARSIRTLLERDGRSVIAHLHVWRVGPGSCAAIVSRRARSRSLRSITGSDSRDSSNSCTSPSRCTPLRSRTGSRPRAPEARRPSAVWARSMTRISNSMRKHRAICRRRLEVRCCFWLNSEMKTTALDREIKVRVFLTPSFSSSPTWSARACSQAVHDALGEHLAGTQAVRRGPGRPAKSGTPSPIADASAASKMPRARKGGKRSQGDVLAVAASLLDYISAHAGERLEQISKGLGVPSKELKLPVQKLFEQNKIKTTGEARDQVLREVTGPTRCPRRRPDGFRISVSGPPWPTFEGARRSCCSMFHNTRFGSSRASLLFMPVLALPAVGQVTTRISQLANGAPTSEMSRSCDISASGRFVAFMSPDDGLAGASSTGQIFVCDRDPDGNGVFDEGNAALELASASFGGGPGNSASDAPAISRNGQFVVRVRLEQSGQSGGQQRPVPRRVRARPRECHDAACDGPGSHSPARQLRHRRRDFGRWLLR